MRRGFFDRCLLLGALWVFSIASAQGNREDRINRAIPLSVAAQSSLDSLRRFSTDPSQLARLEDQLRTKMRLRALQCSQSYTLAESASDEDIRREHGGDPCIAEFDASLADWLGLHSIGFLLARPPLRPESGRTQPFIRDSAGPIQTLRFAAHAGVAIIESLKDTEVIDMESGVPIFSTLREAEDQVTSVSPNGRIYTAVNRAAIRFYDSSTGALIAAPRWCSIVGRCGFYWLDDRSALMYSADSQKSLLYDFRTGTQTPFANDTNAVPRVAQLRAPSEFLTVTNTAATRFRLTYVNDQPREEIIKVVELKRNLLPNDDGGLSADGRYFLALSDGKLFLTSTDTLATDVVDFGQFFGQRLVPTSDPDRLIISGYAMGGPMNTQYYVYAISHRTLAAVDTSRLRNTPFFYQPARQALFELKEDELELVQKIPTEPPVDISAFVARQNKPSSPTVPVTGIMAPTLPSLTMYGSGKPPEPVPGVIADLAKDAEIQGIGVYEADTPQADNGKPPGAYVGTYPGSSISIYQLPPSPPASSTSIPASTIHVRVRPGKRPLVLVLSSFAAVDWQLSLDPGTQLKAVLITGTHGSTVAGQGSARVAAVGNAYSYTLGTPEYTRLQDEIYTWTGRRIELFQCGYKASSFVIAGT